MLAFLVRVCAAAGATVMKPKANAAERSHPAAIVGRLTLVIFKSEYPILLQAYFGPNFTLDSQLDLECLRIPHFYHAFYVYKYASGISAAVALSQRVISGVEGSVTDYLNFLRSCGSAFPLDALKAAGVDMATPAPIASTLDLFEARLGE